MASKIKKIKKELVKELGDGFEVLSDADAADSGIQLAEDEVLVMAVSAPPVPPKEGDNKDQTIAELRGRLHEVNQESASRRIALKEAEGKISQLTGQVTQLTTDLGTFKTTKEKEAAATLFTEYVKEKKIAFVTEEAAKDAQEDILGQLKYDAPVTKETLAPIVDQYVEKKKYIVKKVELPSTDGGRQTQTSEGTVEIDLEEVGNAFNLPVYKDQGES
jgi:hypothetical protein